LQGREAHAASLFAEFAQRAEVLFASARDAPLLFGVDCEAANDLGRFDRLRTLACAASPRLRLLAGAARVAHAADRHDLTGYVADRDRVHASRCLALSGIVDRIGSGDAFAAGVLYGLLQSLAPAEIAEFAVTLAGLKHTMPGDFIACSAADVRAAMQSGGRDVRR
jgi:2-dehydro-3-deoxygluconokinase